MLVSIFREVSKACLGLTLVLALGFGGSAKAFAQSAELAVPADKDWQHDWTSMTFPAQLGGFERSAISQLEERQTNVAAQYAEPSSGSILTLYIYRPGNPSAAIWFDRALVAIGIAEEYGTVDLEEMKIGTFVPAGGTSASGQFGVLEVDGNFRSTGVALYRAGEWLVKLRISSRRLTVAQMDALLKETLTQLPALQGQPTGAAKSVIACEDTLEFGETRPVVTDLGTVAMGQAISVTAQQSAANGTTEQERAQGLRVADPSGVTYCREGQRNYEYNVFRPIGTDDRYTIAVRDAGFSIEVYPDIVGTALDTTENSTGTGDGDGDKNGDTVFAVRSATGLEITLHTPFRGLPNLGPASQSALQGPAIAKVNRPLSDDENPAVTLMVAPE